MDDLQAFVRVVEEQGFSAAALRLDTTAAAISRRVKALEQRLGVRLLQRTTRVDGFLNAHLHGEQGMVG